MREPMTGGKPPKKTATASLRNTGDAPAKKKVTVSQATIDQIKSQGMTAALKKAAAGGVSASYMEGVKRMYGAARVAKATSANINSASKPKAYGANNAPAYRPASASATAKFDAKKAASTSLRGGNAKAGMNAGRGTSTRSTSSDSNATKLFNILGGKGSNAKGPKEAAYRAAAAKKVAAARAAEAKRRAAAKK